MSKIAVSFSNKTSVGGSQAWACVTIERDVDDEMCERPALVAEFIAQQYRIAELGVEVQLAKSHIAPATTAAAAPPFDEFDDRSPGERGYVALSPVVARSNAPPPTRAPVDDDNYSAPGGGGGGQYRAVDWPPGSGKSLWGWAKENDQVKYFIELGKKQRFASKMSEWNNDQVSWACQRFASKQNAVTNGSH